MKVLGVILIGIVSILITTACGLVAKYKMDQTNKGDEKK